MSLSFNTYEILEEEKIRLGNASADGVENAVLRDIILSVDSSEGGARIVFEKLTEENFPELTASFENPLKYGNESYVLKISDVITVYYTSDITKIYAAYAIKRLYSRDGIRKGIVYNTPKVEFRCIHVNLPAKDGIEDFKRLIDMLLAFGHNAIMIEIGGAMEYKRHPEISKGWVEYCNIFKEFNGKTEWARRVSWYPKNSIHADNGGGEYLTYEELTEIIEYCRERHMEIVPEVPTLSHSDYILYKHPELAEVGSEYLPNNACPQNEEYYGIVFDILDEICELFKPTRVNICHDEAYVFGYCPRCRGKNPGELFAYHVRRLHDHLEGKGVKTMMWGDGIMPTSHCGNAAFHRKYPWDGKRIVEVLGKKYKVHDFAHHTIEQYEKVLEEEGTIEGLYTPPKKNSIKHIPRDVEIVDWAWHRYDSSPLLNDYGFYHVYGNFSAFLMRDFSERVKNGIKGISFSNWGASDFDSLQRNNTFFAIAYNSLAVWGGEFDSNEVFDNTFLAADAAYSFINYRTLSKKHLKILHTTDAFINHPFFHCGYSIVKEDFRIGEYEIKYTDGTVDTLPIYWGQNIGRNCVIWDSARQTTLNMEDGLSARFIYEPIGESRPVFIDGKSYYEISLPIEKEVESVTLKAKDGYNIELKSYETR